MARACSCGDVDVVQLLLHLEKVTLKTTRQFYAPDICDACTVGDHTGVEGKDPLKLKAQ